MVIWNKINNIHHVLPIYVKTHCLHKQIMSDRIVIQLLVVPLMLANFSYTKVFLIQASVSLAAFGYLVWGPFGFIAPKSLSYLAFQSLDRTGRRLFQKRVCVLNVISMVLLHVSFNSSCSFNRSIKYIQCLPKLLKNSITY